MWPAGRVFETPALEQMQINRNFNSSKYVIFSNPNCYFAIFVHTLGTVD